MKATMLRGAVVTAGGLAVVLYDNGFIAVPGPVWAVIAFATAALLAAPWSDLGILRRMSGSQLQSTLRFQALDEEGWTRHRILSNSDGDGAVAVVVDGSRVLFIDAQRPAIARNLWELPRGHAHTADKTPKSGPSRSTQRCGGLRWTRSERRSPTTAFVTVSAFLRWHSPGRKAS